MSPAGPELLDARRSPGSAVVVVVLRSTRWPYSCGLACSMHLLARRLARAGAELVFAVDEPASRRALVVDAWGLDAPPLPLAPPLAEALGLRDRATGRADDGVGVLTPSGVWAATWCFGDPFGSAHPEQVVRAVQDLQLPAVGESAPAARQEVPSAADRMVCALADAARTLGRALTSAERTAALLDAAGASARTELAARRLRTYVAALATIRKARHEDLDGRLPGAGGEQGERGEEGHRTTVPFVHRELPLPCGT
jgi:hypothetical protein